MALEAMVCNHGCYLNISGALRVLQVGIQISEEQWGRPIGKVGESPLNMFYSNVITWWDVSSNQRDVVAHGIQSQDM
jgi:hypothetical protein